MSKLTNLLQEIIDNLIEAYDYILKAKKLSVLSSDYLYDTLINLAKSTTLLINAMIENRKPKKVSMIYLHDSIRLLKIAKSIESDKDSIENIKDALYRLNEAWNTALKD